MLALFLSQRLPLTHLIPCQSGRYPWALGLYDNDGSAYANNNASGNNMAIPLAYKLLPEVQHRNP